MSKKRRALVLAALITILLASTITFASCGKKSSATNGQSQTIPQSKTGNATIDGIVNDLDRQMNSVNSNDFSDDQLNDSALNP